MKSKLLILFLAFILIVGMIFTITYKPSIHQATIEQLEAIEGIGLILSDRVGSYLLNNPECDIDDLLEVKGIGKERIKLIKKHWR